MSIGAELGQTYFAYTQLKNKFEDPMGEGV